MYINVESAWTDNENTFKIIFSYQPFFQAYFILDTNAAVQCQTCTPCVCNDNVQYSYVIKNYKIEFI